MVNTTQNDYRADEARDLHAELANIRRQMKLTEVERLRLQADELDAQVRLEDLWDEVYQDGEEAPEESPTAPRHAQDDLEKQGDAEADKLQAEFLARLGLTADIFEDDDEVEECGCDCEGQVLSISGGVGEAVNSVTDIIGALLSGRAQVFAVPRP